MVKKIFGIIKSGAYIWDMLFGRHAAIFASFLFSFFFLSGQNKFTGRDSVITYRGEKVYKRVQFQPEFPGGKDSLLAFFDRSLIIPKGNKGSHTITVCFIIDKNGSVADPRISQGVPGKPEYGIEALRVIKSMPVWKPAVHLGKHVHCQFTMPVTFEIK
jgi:TonB family protein